jgi:hypothetical protein
MRHAIIAVLALVACGKSAEQEAKEEAQRNQPKPTEVAPAETVHKDLPPPPTAKPTAPEPDPNKPEEVERARNQAMIDGRDKDVLRYCAMAKLDDKSNPQALLGCTLSACRIKDADTAKQYSKALPKLLMDQAKRVCGTAKIDL